MDGSNYANDELSACRSIGWQAALIVNRLHCQAQLLELNDEIDSMKFLEGASISHASLNGIIVTTEQKIPPAILDGGIERLPTRACPPNTSNTCGIISEGATVRLIDDGRDISQIGEAVIELVTVNVVNHSIGPLTVNMQPYDAVSQVHLSEDTNLAVSGVGDTTGRSTNRAPMAAYFPPKLASVGKIIQFVPNLLRVNHDSKPNKEDHETPSSKPDRGDAEEKEREAHAKYVAHRLNELRSWERKISGLDDRTGWKRWK